MAARIQACRLVREAQLAFLNQPSVLARLQPGPGRLWVSQTPCAALTRRQTILQLHKALSTSIPHPKQNEHPPPNLEPYPTYFQDPAPATSAPKPPQSAGGSTPPPPLSHPPPEHAPPPPPSGRWARRLRWAFYAFCLGIGASLGCYQRKLVSLLLPPLPLEPGSPEDLEMLAETRRNATEIELVQRLLADPEWTTWPAYAGIPEDRQAHRITTGPMRGSRGIAFQQVFSNEHTGETVVVIMFGRGMCGFPRTVHGGAIATLIDECLGRTAIMAFEERTGVTARLELNYRAPTRTDAFYVIKCTPMVMPAEGEGNGNGNRNGTSGQEDAVVEVSPKKTKSAGAGKKSKKMWVTGRLETLHGQVCVEAKGLFVVPKGFKLKSLDEKF